jgi:hypothetical protein
MHRGYPAAFGLEMFVTIQSPLGSLFRVQGETGPLRRAVCACDCRRQRGGQPRVGRQPDGLNAELLVHHSELVLLAKYGADRGHRPRRAPLGVDPSMYPLRPPPAEQDRCRRTRWRCCNWPRCRWRRRSCQCPPRRGVARRRCRRDGAFSRSNSHGEPISARCGSTHASRRWRADRARAARLRRHR